MKIGQKLSIPLIIVSLGNIITGISRGDNLIYYLLYVGIILIPAIVLLSGKIKVSYKFMSLLMLLFSVASIFGNDITVLNGVFFLTYSLYIAPKNKYLYWIYGAITTTATIARYTFGGFLPSDIFVHLSGISFVLLVYSHYIHVVPQKLCYNECVSYINLVLIMSIK